MVAIERPGRPFRRAAVFDQKERKALHARGPRERRWTGRACRTTVAWPCCGTKTFSHQWRDSQLWQNRLRHAIAVSRRLGDRPRVRTFQHRRGFRVDLWDAAKRAARRRLLAESVRKTLPIGRERSESDQRRATDASAGFRFPRLHRVADSSGSPAMRPSCFATVGDGLPRGGQLR